jgi:hypothetical protein
MKDVLRPGRVHPLREIGTTHDVPTGAIDPVPRAQTPRTKNSSLLAPRLPISRWRTVGRPYQPFGLKLGCGVVGKHLVMACRQMAVVVVFESLYEELGLLLPRPQPEPRAPDGHRTARGIDEDAHARRARGCQDVARSFDVDFIGEMQEPRITLVKADVGRGMEDGNLGGGCGRVLGPVVEAVVVVGQWRPRDAESRLDLLRIGHVNLAEIDVLGQARRQIETRGGAYVENPDPFGMFTAFEQMSNDPPAKKACLNNLS